MFRNHRRLWRVLAVFSMLLLSATSLSLVAEARGSQSWTNSGSDSIRADTDSTSFRVRPTRTSRPTRTPVQRPTRTPTAQPTQTATQQPTQAPTQTAPSNGDFQATLESQFLTLINEYRAQLGLPALTRNGALDTAARNHSRDMAVNRYFSHTSQNGDSPFDRMAAAGYSCNGSRGENIAAGYASAQAAFDAWRNSPGHDANMRNGSYRSIGIGVYYDAASPYRYYWTTTFGSC